MNGNVSQLFSWLLMHPVNIHSFPMRIVLIGQTFNSFIHLWHQPHPSIHPFSFPLIMQGCRSAGVYPSCLKSLVHHRTTQDNRSLTPHSDTRNWTMLPWGDCVPLHHHVALESAVFIWPNIGQRTTLSAGVVPLPLSWTWNWRGRNCIST